MAKSIQFAESENRGAVIVYRFIGTTSASSKIVSLLQSVCRQIAREFGTTIEALAGEGQEKFLYDLVGISEALKKCLALADAHKPVFLFLDALDQISADDNAKNLNWLPKELPENAKFIVSALPELEGHLSGNYKIHLPVLPESEAQLILGRWFQSRSRKLTDEQNGEILSKFSHTGLPIYLKLAFEQAKDWKSYSTGFSLKQDVEGIINDLMENLEHEHTKNFVEHSISYMLCGKYQGLAENEILEILVFDKEYWEGTFLPQTHPEHREELKQVTKIPIVVWSRLFLDLEPFLTEVDADGVPIITFFHKQFVKVLQERYKLIKIMEEN
jgi:hypothetical protein